jgi:hypothetical protein
MQDLTLSLIGTIIAIILNKLRVGNMTKKIFCIIILFFMFSTIIMAMDTATNITPTTQYANAIGIDVGMIGRALPGISYTRTVDKALSYSFFLGAMYDADIYMVLLEVNAYYLINEYFYVGLGASAALDEDGSAIFGVANPTIGMISSVTDNIKFYVETTVLIFSYRTKDDLDSHIVIGSPSPIFKTGIRYYF